MPAGLFAAADMVRACNLRSGRERVATEWVGLDRQAVEVENGPTLQPAASLREAACDAWLLPGLWATSIDALEDTLLDHHALVEALRKLPRRSQVWSYCAGVPLAAAAGLLDGHHATATWWLQPMLAQRYPRVRWQGGPAVADGRIATAAGPGGYLPLLLDRLGELYGGTVLRDVQNVLVLPLPRRRHAAFEAVEAMSIRDPALRSLLWFAQRTPAQSLDLAAAAGHLQVSVRTLCRRLKDATGVPAGDWLRRVKLSQVGEALRHSHAPLKSLCDQYGFGSEASLHRAFKEATGLTPAAYRQAYSEELPTGAATVAL
jgi:transcriptional regulator GlxA family with amidase domain